MPPRIPVRAACIPPVPSATIKASSSPVCVRALSSTAPTLALGPQSPNYIEVPKPLQPTFPIKPKVQGHLPIPRDIFKTRNHHAKESDAFLAESTKLPQKLKVPGPHSRDAQYRLYKQRLAEQRRTNLQQGVKELHERKTITEAKYLSKIQAIGAYRRKVAMAPPREVDILTQTSIQKGIRDFLADGLPERPDNIAARRAAYQRRAQKVQAVRTSRLHDLYTNARTFIVNESQLDCAITEAFGTEESPMGWDEKGQMGPLKSGDVSTKNGLSPWKGPMPEGIGDRLQKLKGGEGVGLARERVKKLAEELTGGKL